MKKKKGNKGRGSEEDAIKPEGWEPPVFNFGTKVVTPEINALKDYSKAEQELYDEQVLAEKPSMLRGVVLPSTNYTVQGNNFNSGQLDSRLIGPGDNDYGRNNKLQDKDFVLDPYMLLSQVFNISRDSAKKFLLTSGYPGGLESAMKEIGFVIEQPQPTFTMADIPVPFQESAELRKKKGEDYRSGGVEMKDYFPFGMQSYFTMINTKVLRLKSLLTSGKDPNNESIRDTLLDLMNYACFNIEAIDKGEV